MRININSGIYPIFISRTRVACLPSSSCCGLFTPSLWHAFRQVSVLDDHNIYQKDWQLLRITLPTWIQRRWNYTSMLTMSEQGTRQHREYPIASRERNTHRIRYLYGLMFEDINFSGDGGIYAELIQNRAFRGMQISRFCSRQDADYCSRCCNHVRTTTNRYSRP